MPSWRVFLTKLAPVSSRDTPDTPSRSTLVIMLPTTDHTYTTRPDTNLC